MLINTVVISYCVRIIISKLKPLKFQHKDNYFQTDAGGFICLHWIMQRGEKEKVSKKYTSHNSTETR